MNKKIGSLIFIVVFAIILLCIIIPFLNYNKNKCIKNGGKVITNVYGLYDKCIYGDD